MRRRVRIYLIGILSLGYLYVVSYVAFSAMKIEAPLTILYGRRAVVFGVLNAIYQIAFTKITDQYLYVSRTISIKVQHILTTILGTTGFYSGQRKYQTSLLSQ